MSGKWVLCLCAALASLGLAAGCASKCCSSCGDCNCPKGKCHEQSSLDQQHFGEKMTLADSKTVPIRTVLASPDKYKDKPIRVSAVVREVCLHKGCWIRMADGDKGDGLFVKFVCPIEGRLIPTEAVGKPVIVEGTLVVEMVDEDEARHIAEEAGKSAEEIRKIVGPQKRMRMSAPAAVIMGLKSSGTAMAK
ncbi:MAG: DUF4920 domain-containing protein [Phycisphaerales bacterium]|nr:DUF4920 domain-containing protein [Phycisphaerales bacterium]